MVKAWEDTILIPTYERGPEDPNPLESFFFDSARQPRRSLR